jgi:Transcriptional regulators of sugar metabolism
MYNERREKIRELLSSKPFVSLREMEEAFPDISSMTLRRDIEHFEREGDAIKVRGGARSMKFITTTMEDSFTSRLSENIEEKEMIAKKAAAFLESGRSIFIDSGTTLLKLAAHVPGERFTFTTTDPNIALELCKTGQSIVNIVGGMLNRDNLSVSGFQATRFLDDINIDIAFISPSGLSAQNGFTGGNYSECELKKMIVQKARKVVVLMDRSKLDKCLPYTFCSMSQVHTIITDAPLPADICESAQANDVEIINALR